ncbi:MAG: hypothetical protein ACJ790_01075 [Myxococcaceae bacterium]
MTSALSLQLSHRAQFERNLTRAVLTAAAAGLASLLFYGSATAGFFQWTVAAAAVFAFSGGGRFERWVIRAVAGLLTLVALLIADQLGTIVCGALTGVFLMFATIDARGTEATVAQLRPRPFGYALAAAAGAMLFPVGTVLGNVLAHRLVGAGLSWMIAMPFAGAVAALFTGFSALPAHLLLQDDPVEARASELVIKLSGELSELVGQLVGAYRHCGELLAQLPREPARAELAQTLSKATREALELAEHWSGVEAQMDSGAKGELEAQLHDLKKSVETSRDELAKKQLQHAAASLEEELQNLDTVSLRRERALAKLKALGAQLGRTRVSLLGLRAAQTQVKGADLLALSRKVQALSALEATRSDLEDAAAVSAELDAIDAGDAQRARAAAAR